MLDPRICSSTGHSFCISPFQSSRVPNVGLILSRIDPDWLPVVNGAGRIRSKGRKVNIEALDYFHIMEASSAFIDWARLCHCSDICFRKGRLNSHT